MKLINFHSLSDDVSLYSLDILNCCFDIVHVKYLLVFRNTIDTCMSLYLQLQKVKFVEKYPRKGTNVTPRIVFCLISDISIDFMLNESFAVQFWPAYLFNIPEVCPIEPFSTWNSRSRLDKLTFTVRETGVSRFNGVPMMKRPPWTSQYNSAVIYGAHNCIPHDAERLLPLWQLYVCCFSILLRRTEWLYDKKVPSMI